MFPEINLILGTISTFNLCAGLGLISMVCLSMSQAKRLGVDRHTEQFLIQSIPFVSIFAIAPACLSDIVFRWADFRNNPIGFGMTFYGWLTGCIVGWWFFAIIAHRSPSFVLNFFCPTLAMSQSFGRVGCFFAGCCYGRPTSSGIGLSFPENSFPWKRYGDAPLFPIQLMEAFWLLIVTIILVKLIPFRHRTGSYFILMGTGRFFAEFLRGDNRGSFFGFDQLSPAQFMSLFFVTVGIVLRITMRERRELPV